MITQRDLSKAFFPDESKATFAAWKEFDKILNLAQQDKPEREELFRKYASNAAFISDHPKTQRRNFVIAGYMLEQDPTLATLPLDNQDFFNFVENWALFYPIKKHNGKVVLDDNDQIVLDFVRDHADVLAHDAYVLFPSEALIGCFACDEPKFELAHAALCNETFVDMIGKQYETDKALAAGSFLDTLASKSLGSDKDIEKFASLTQHAMDTCPALLKIRNGDRQTVMERIEKHLIEENKKRGGQSLKNFIHTFSKDVKKKHPYSSIKSFHSTLSRLCSPLLPVLLEAEESHPDVLQVQSINGTTIEERLGLGNHKQRS